MPAAIWWVRRDLRLGDNQALAAALAHGGPVIPLFILDPALWASAYVGEKRLAFLLGGLRQLDAALRERGSRLLVRSGAPHEALAGLLAESGADAIFAEADYSPYARRRDGRVAARLPLHLVDGLTVRPPGTVLKADGRPYTVFTPFSRAWKALPPPEGRDLLPAPRHIPTPADLPGDPLPDAPLLAEGMPFPPGEAEARRRLEAFTGGSGPPIYRYHQQRDRLDLAGTSGLSPYLRLGMVSARQAVVAALASMAAAPSDEASKGARAWLDELIWREFFVHVLHHFPHVRREAFRPTLRAIAWENDEAAFAAWCEGRTGYPVVDAAMRQLARTGWMHNRARMIVAAFLTKDLLIDWRWGERWFMQHLLDGDPAANNGGWQWAAGTGTDAAPYFRVFNPVAQGTRHDPHGDYVRHWLPALARVPDAFVHRPWEMPGEVQRAAGCVSGRDYPPPIVDHRRARERALAAYRRSRQGT